MTIYYFMKISGISEGLPLKEAKEAVIIQKYISSYM